MMKIYAMSNKPQALVDAINKAIKDNVLKTWGVVYNDKKESLYTHTPEQWNETAMPKPYVNDDKVSFVISFWTNKEPDENTKGYILGRFVEILMVHFQSYFSKLEIHK